MTLETKQKKYSLRKAKQILFSTFFTFKKKRSKLIPNQQEEMRKCMRELEGEIIAKNKRGASLFAHKLENLAGLYLKKNPLENFKDLIIALVVALIVAISIRQVWVELYAIPTGSMRPTLLEKDKLVVSKTNFGINVPLKAKHLSFDPSLVKRSGVVVFTGESMDDIPDVETRYFLIFPGYRQFVKRMIGKPGDVLYFYGGEIYGIDKEGNDISHELRFPTSKNIDFIPFIGFEGKVSTPITQISGVYSCSKIHQMNTPISRLYMTNHNVIKGEMLPIPQIRAPGQPAVKNYADLWGMKNYATSRLITKKQLEKFYNQSVTDLGIPKAEAYLELRHTPQLSSLKIIRDIQGKVRPSIGFCRTHIPLNEESLRALFDNLYTARFIVKNNFLYRYGSQMLRTSSPHIPRIDKLENGTYDKLENGTYEFYYGKAYKVGFGGVRTELPKTHPLYKFSLERIQFWYNLGIEFDNRFAPTEKNQVCIPSRYAYFRDGDLYTLNGPVVDRNSQSMTAYLAHEQVRKDNRPLQKPYTPFIDMGPPLKNDGSLDKEKVLQYGLRVPDKKYLVLGDNHAMSADSRDFGFVPEENLRGAPDFLIWPAGNRLGPLFQPHYPVIIQPRLIVWGSIALLSLLYYIWYRRKHRFPLDLD